MEMGSFGHTLASLLVLKPGLWHMESGEFRCVDISGRLETQAWKFSLNVTSDCVLQKIVTPIRELVH
jgi:hypothetical protein